MREAGQSVSVCCTQQLCVGARGPASGNVIRRVPMEARNLFTRFSHTKLWLSRVFSKSVHVNGRAASNTALEKMKRPLRNYQYLWFHYLEVCV